MGTRLSEVDTFSTVPENKAKSTYSYDYSSGFIRNCPDILVHLDESFRVLYVNKICEDTFSVKNDDLLGTHWLKLPGVKQNLIKVKDEELSQKVCDEEHPYDFAFWSGHGEHEEEVKYHARIHAEKPEHDNPVTYWLTARYIPVSDPQFAPAANKRLTECFPDFVCRYDEDQRIIYANNACRTLFGVPASEILGKSKEALDINDHDSLDLWQEKLDKAFSEGTQDDFCFCIKNGSNARHYHTIFTPERDSENEVRTVISTTREVTELKEKEARLEKDNDNLRSLNTYLDNFIYTIAHDLRGPVGNLKSLLWLYKLEKEEKAKNDIMDKLEGTFIRLDNRLNGLIGLIESMANLESKVTRCKLEKITRDIQADLENRPDFTPYVIHKHFDVKEIKYIEAYMVSILSNLLSNIMKYREPSRPLRIRVSTYRMGKFVILEVEDNGIGIDMDTVGKDLFKPFRRFTQQSEGKGIGLHIIKTMVEKNGGRIEVNSKLGEGTTFQLYLKEY